MGPGALPAVASRAQPRAQVYSEQMFMNANSQRLVHWEA